MINFQPRYALKNRFKTFAIIALLLWLPTGIHAEGLLEIYELAESYDAELNQAQYDYQALRENLPIARSGLRPQFSASANYSRRNDWNDDTPSYNRSVMSLRLSQTIFNYPQMVGVDQAKLALTQAEAELLAVRQTLMIRVSTAYFDVLRAQAELLFRRSELDAIGRQKEQNERRFEVGLVPVTDVKDAQAQYDLATAQEIAAANALSTAQEALIVISGSEVTRLEELRDDAPLVAPSPANINEWVKTAEEQNIPLVVSRLTAANAQNQIRADRALRYPTLNLVGERGWTDSTRENSTTPRHSAEVRLELSVPILTGGRNNARVRKAKYEALAANQSLTTQRRATVQATRDAYRSVVADISRTNALRQALISTQKSLEAQEAGFVEGLLTSLEVLRSLRDTFQAQSDYSGSRYDYILNSLTLKQAAGILQRSDLEQIDGWLTPRQ